MIDTRCEPNYITIRIDLAALQKQCSEYYEVFDGRKRGKKSDMTMSKSKNI